MAAPIGSPPAMRACKSANTAATSASKRTCWAAGVREADGCHASVLGARVPRPECGFHLYASGVGQGHAARRVADYTEWGASAP